MHVNHRYGPAKLKLRNQLEKESRRWLSAQERLIGARLRVTAEVPMPSDAAEIEPAFTGVPRESATKGMTEQGGSSRYQRSAGRRGCVEERLGRINAASMRNRKAGTVKPAHRGHLLLSILDLRGIDRLLGFESAVHALGGYNRLALVFENERRILPIEDNDVDLVAKISVTVDDMRGRCLIPLRK